MYHRPYWKEISRKEIEKVVSKAESTVLSKLHYDFLNITDLLNIDNFLNIKNFTILININNLNIDSFTKHCPWNLLNIDEILNIAFYWNMKHTAPYKKH